MKGLPVAIVALVFLLSSVAFDQLGAAESSTPTAAPVQPASPSIIYIQADDVSGTMGPFIDAVRAAAANQLRKLLPGDVLARIEFDADARLVSLTRVRDASDIDNVLKIDLGAAKGKKTEISRGLLRAREIAMTHANGSHRTVLVLATDADLDPRDSVSAEQRRVADVAAWWRDHPETAIIMVAPNDAVRVSKPFTDLATRLGARTVGLDEFRTNAIVAREIEAIRPTPHGSIPVRPVTLRVMNVPEIAVAVLIALGLGAVLLLRRRRRGALVPPEELLGSSVESRAKVHVVVTAGGSTREVLLDVRPDEAEEIVTIGGPGAVVELPGYRGRLPITITSRDGASGDVLVPEGVTASIGADRIDAHSGPVHFIGRTALKTAGAHVQIRLVSEGASS